MLRVAGAELCRVNKGQPANHRQSDGSVRPLEASRQRRLCVTQEMIPTHKNGHPPPRAPRSYLNDFHESPILRERQSVGSLCKSLCFGVLNKHQRGREASREEGGPLKTGEQLLSERQRRFPRGLASPWRCVRMLLLLFDPDGIVKKKKAYVRHQRRRAGEACGRRLDMIGLLMQSPGRGRSRRPSAELRFSVPWKD